jgi:hypothetical protein
MSFFTLGFLVGFKFLGASRLRLRICPRSLLIRFCVDAVTCFEMKSEVVTSGVLLEISDKIVLPVRNASRTNALTVPLAPTKEGVATIEIDQPENCLFRDPSVNIEDLRRRARYRWGRISNRDPPASGNTVREDSYRMS